MPNIGPVELVIILVIALLILGPGKLPDVGAAIGKSIREFRKATNEVTDSVTGTPATPPPAAAPVAAAPAPAPVAPAPVAAAPVAAAPVAAAVSEPAAAPSTAPTPASVADAPTPPQA